MFMGWNFKAPHSESITSKVTPFPKGTQFGVPLNFVACAEQNIIASVGAALRCSWHPPQLLNWVTDAVGRAGRTPRRWLDWGLDSTGSSSLREAIPFDWLSCPLGVRTASPAVERMLRYLRSSSRHFAAPRVAARPPPLCSPTTSEKLVVKLSRLQK